MRATSLHVACMHRSTHLFVSLQQILRLCYSRCFDSAERMLLIANASCGIGIGHSGVQYAQPAPNESFAFYDYLLSWGASVGETAVRSNAVGSY